MHSLKTNEEGFKYFPDPSIKLVDQKHAGFLAIEWKIKTDNGLTELATFVP